jgi:hypothetical protein
MTSGGDVTYGRWGLDRSMMRLATRPVQPVWWDAPSPAPLSPWKHS